jgi:predicted nucleic acid-binding protein
MISYLDTSSLAKLYVEEPDSGRIRSLLAASDEVASSLVAYPEMRSALARRRREGHLEEAAYESSLRDFRRDWRTVRRISATEELVEEAGELADRHGLRGMDAIHLASALFLRASLGTKGLVFSTADVRLARAAKAEGMTTGGVAWGAPGSSGLAAERGVRWRRARKR